MEHCATPPSAAAPEAARWSITAAPFTRADRLRAFLTAVGGIEGVTELVAERFRWGAVSLSLRYSGSDSLVNCLAALPNFRPAVETEAGATVRLLLDEEIEDA